MEINTIIDRYVGMPECEFKSLMSSLPQKLQEHFVIVIPSYHLNDVIISAYNVISKRITLPVVELRNDEGELPIPPRYKGEIVRMEKILQEDYKRRV